jgi:hypothetical protein
LKHQNRKRRPNNHVIAPEVGFTFTALFRLWISLQSVPIKNWGGRGPEVKPSASCSALTYLKHALLWERYSHSWQKPALDCEASANRCNHPYKAFPSYIQNISNVLGFRDGILGAASLPSNIHEMHPTSLRNYS